MKERNDKTTTSDKSGQKHDEEIDIDDFEKVNPTDALSEDELDIDDFEEVGSTSVSSEEILLHNQYAPRVQWTVNAGMNSERMHKMYSLFTQKNTSFYLSNLESESFDDDTGAYTFKSSSNGDKVVLFKPGLRTATYTTSSKNDSAGEITADLGEILETVKSASNDSGVPTRFVVPMTEQPDDPKKGPQHAVLLVIDYDPKEQSITPRVLDSIGRNTLADSFSKFWRSKSQSTADAVLNEQIQAVFKQPPESIKANQLERIAYNHQNRATEGNCGAYTFVSIYHTVQSFVSGKPMQKFVSSIPSSGFISSDSYLNRQAKEEIEDCVNFRSLSADKVDDALAGIGKDKSMDYSLQEFKDALTNYKSLRQKEGERSSFSITGHQKDAKITAASLLIQALDVIQKDEQISDELYNQIHAHREELHNSRLGRIVNFHLQQSQFKTLDSLLFSTQKLEMDDFVIIPSEEPATEGKKKEPVEKDDLFEVPDISGEQLATDDRASDVKTVKGDPERQKGMKEKVKELREKDEQQEVSKGIEIK